MSLAVWRFRRYLIAAAGVVAVLAAVTTSLAQSSTGKWWHGYGNGADNSRYFASTTDQQVQRQSAPGRVELPSRRDREQSDCRARRDLRPRPQRLDRRGRREDRARAVGPREHERHEQPRHDVLGKPRRPRSASHLPHEQPVAAAGREDREIDYRRSASTAPST